MTYRCAMCGSQEPGQPYASIFNRDPNEHGRHPRTPATVLTFCSPYCAARYYTGICELAYRDNPERVGDDFRAVAWGVEMIRAIRRIEL